MNQIGLQILRKAGRFYDDVALFKSHLPQNLAERFDNQVESTGIGAQIRQDLGMLVGDFSIIFSVEEVRIIEPIIQKELSKNSLSDSLEYEWGAIFKQAQSAPNGYFLFFYPF